MGCRTINRSPLEIILSLYSKPEAGNITSSVLTKKCLTLDHDPLIQCTDFILFWDSDLCPAPGTWLCVPYCLFPSLYSKA